MNTYQVWSPDHDIPTEYIEAETGLEARKLFATRHRLERHLVCAHRLSAIDLAMRAYERNVIA